MVLNTVPLTVQETYVLHDGPPYANGDLHIGKLFCAHITSGTKVKALSWTTNRVSCSLLWEIAHIHSALLFNASHNHQEETTFC